MKELKVIAFTHKTTDIQNIGYLHLDEAQREERLTQLKLSSGVEELMYLSTCNRVEFIFVTHKEFTPAFRSQFYLAFNPSVDVQWMEKNAEFNEGEDAVHHLMRLASSLDSLVIGEREIITQVRNAYEESLKFGLTGDLLRIAIKHTIESAKEIYTYTDIAKNPVSVVSLAYRTLREFNLKNDARFILIGAGETNTTMAKFLKKHGFQNFSVYNRTLAKAQKLARQLQGKAFTLEELNGRKEGFDVLISCTGSEEPIVDAALYDKLLVGEKSKKIIIDLALPNDIDKAVPQNFSVHYINIESLKEKAGENMKKREKELSVCHEILDKQWAAFQEVYHERQVINAMQGVPQKVKEIRQHAVDNVFAKDIENLDENSKEVLNKVLAYMEKKYISGPMVMAKEILLNKSHG
ncbi:MAG: glutamyl-tRNA reductase [Flavobacteriales bacterium]